MDDKTGRNSSNFLLNLKSNRSKEKLDKTFVCGIIRMPNKGGGFVEHK